MGAAEFPDALPDASTVTSSQTLLAADLADQQDTDRNELRAIATKLGLVASTPVKGRFLGATADGDSEWLPAPGPNLLLNGDGRVNQRVSAATTDNGYGPDMWRLVIEAATAATLTKTIGGLPSSGSSGSGLLLEIGASNNNKCGFWQPIRSDSSIHTRGGTVSLQLNARASVSRIGDVRAAAIEFVGTADNGGSAWGDPVSSWGSAGTNPTLSTNWSYCGTPVNLSVPTSWGDPIKIEALPVGNTTQNLGVLVWIDDKTTTAGDYLIVTDLKLEAGDICTAVHESKIEELIDACEAYYQKSIDLAATPLSASQGEAYPTYAGTVGSNDIYERVNFRTRMYGTPTVRIWPWTTPANTSRVSNSGGTDLAAGSGTPYVPKATGFAVQNASGGSITTGGNQVLFAWDAVAPW